MTVGVGVIGLGFMGRTHVRAFRACGERCAVVAVADRSVEAFGADSASSGDDSGNLAEADAGGLELGEAARYADAHTLLADKRVDAVSICTPTETHTTLAVAALRAGKHVLVEKPVSLALGDISALEDAARSADRVCMPAHCMRHWAEWAWLADAVQSGEFGTVRHARFERIGMKPEWGNGFYDDPTRCGGALFDLHVHDADFVLGLFGLPLEVDARGDTRHVSTTYRFRDGPHVSAVGGWVRGQTLGFRMRFTVEFDRAIADFDLARDVPLALHTIDGRLIHPIDAGGPDAWACQAASFVRSAMGDCAPPVTLDDARLVTRVLLAELESTRCGRPVRL